MPPVPYEIELLSLIDRFGAHAVMGRTLSSGEIKRMLVTESIVNAYHGRKASGDKWAEWDAKNPYLSALLKEVEKAVNDNG